MPLFVVTLASQNRPCVAAIRAAGYAMPISGITALTGVATLVLAPLGAFVLDLSEITAAICMGRAAHPDLARRYAAAVSCGAILCLIGVFGAAAAGVPSAFSREFAIAIAGALALFVQQWRPCYLRR